MGATTGFCFICRAVAKSRRAIEIAATQGKFDLRRITLQRAKARCALGCCKFICLSTDNATPWFHLAAALWNIAPRPTKWKFAVYCTTNDVRGLNKDLKQCSIESNLTFVDRGDLNRINALPSQPTLTDFYHKVYW